ncbi:MAG: DoxX family protein [Acidobacteria bacterium]|nr:DoxX family protein [Acidobacteriota bacterium]
MALSKNLLVVSWALRVIVAAILFQTLYFKFTAAPESVYIFSKLGMEPVGRIGSGVAELIAVVLLMIPACVPYGAILALGVISGAIASHLTKLGIVVINSDGTADGGLLFGLALIVFFGSLAVLWLHRTEIPVVGHRLWGR